MIYTASFLKDIVSREDRVQPSLILETPFTKEIRIVFKKGQEMKEHIAPYPIVVQVFKGKIDFGVSEKRYELAEGDLISLDGKVKHDLIALEDSIVRLTISKQDTIERVEAIH